MASKKELKKLEYRKKLIQTMSLEVILVELTRRNLYLSISSNTELNSNGKPRMAKKELDKQIKAFYKSGTRIPAIKLARIELCCGFKEGLDYCNKVANWT